MPPPTPAMSRQPELRTRSESSSSQFVILRKYQDGTAGFHTQLHHATKQCESMMYRLESNDCVKEPQRMYSYAERQSDTILQGVRKQHQTQRTPMFVTPP